MRRTKIVATVGPATGDLDAMTELIEAGVDVVRLNFSHGSRADHAAYVALVREAAARARRDVSILGDLPGPKIRLGAVPGGRVELEAGRDVVLTTLRSAGATDRLHVAWSRLPAATRPGGAISLADGRVRLRVLDAGATDVNCTVEVGGSVASRAGLSVHGSAVRLPATTRADLTWIDFAVAARIDMLAVSFVRSAADLESVARWVRKADADIPLIAKIETPEAAESADEIIGATSAGVMVARGDLGIELPVEQVPSVQRRLLALAGEHSVPSITATQMLASMVTSGRPTRAEVSDIATAIHQGTDAVMLSEETAVGAHAAEAVRVMDRVARTAESDLPYDRWASQRVRTDPADVARSVARAAVGATNTLPLAALVVPTRSGRTARLVSAHRPRVPVLALSPRIETVRRLKLLFGVRCVLHRDWEEIDSLLEDCARAAAQAGAAQPGDLIGITGGLATQRLGTNLFEIHRVP